MLLEEAGAARPPGGVAPTRRRRPLEAPRPAAGRPDEGGRVVLTRRDGIRMLRYVVGRTGRLVHHFTA